jgi:MFS family permease
MLVVDSSMNVSISAVVEDLNTTVSGVQSAIALEAFVSAAFILISSKVGELIGSKRASVLRLLGYVIGAIAMTLTQSLPPIMIFRTIIGGLGASLLLSDLEFRLMKDSCQSWKKVATYTVLTFLFVNLPLWKIMSLNQRHPTHPT